MTAVRNGGKSYVARVILACVLSLMLHAAASAQTVVTDVAYGPDPQQRLDICLPRTGRSARPAVVIIHGGGWSHGDKAPFTKSLCQLAAKDGIVAFTINYRLANGGNALWPAQLVDVQLAIRWAKANALRFGVDPAHICALGGSAGAHLAVFVGALTTVVPGQYADLFPRVSPQASCVVEEFGPVDLTRSYRPPTGMLFGRNLGPAEVKRREAEASPVFALGAGAAPTMIVHGTQDSIVPLDQARQLYDKLRASGATAKWLTFPGGHGFKGLPRLDQSAITESELDFIAQSGRRG